MQICLLGDFSEDLDEGYKNFSHSLAKEIEKYYPIVQLNVKRMGTVLFWRELGSARPDIIHTIAQPTTASMVFTHMMKLISPRAKTVITALRLDNYINEKNCLFNGFILRKFYPDLMLVPSLAQVKRLKDIGLHAVNLPIGVDLNRFRPCNKEQKIYLRKKYKLDPTRPVVLHVGHLMSSRNMTVLTKLVPKGIQVVIVGSTYLGVDQGLVAKLEQAGVIVYVGYQTQIEEFYQLADCYAFPLIPGESLSMPLSILEAMATNIPVITTRFKGVEDTFREGAGLKFVRNPEEIVPELMNMLPFDKPISNRDQITSFSWEAVGTQLREHYQSVMNTIIG